MADELEEVLKKFALSNLEQNGAWLEMDDIDIGITECKNSIIGKIRGEKVANFTGVKNFVTAAWGYPKDLTMTELGPNLFQFFIPDAESRLRILGGRPWLIDSQILVLNRWEAGIEENTEAFKYAPLWVQVWNLPIHWLSKEVGRKIGKVFREVKEVLISHSGGKEGKHLKLRSYGNNIEQEANPVRNERVQNLTLTKSTDRVEEYNEMPMERIQESGKEDEELLDAQETDKRGVERDNEDKYGTSSEMCGLENESPVEVNPAVSGELGNMKLEKRIEDGKALVIEM
nr:uncharacterized protein LOC113706127 [Coffea arabica]